MIDYRLTHGLGFRFRSGFSRHLQEAIRFLGIGSKRRIGHAVHLIGEKIIHTAFSDAENPHRMGKDHFITLRTEIRQDTFPQHRPALLRGAGQHNHDLPVFFKSASGSCATCVVEDGASLREHCLSGVILGILVAGRNIVIESLILGVVSYQLQAEGFCKNIFGQIIARRAKAPGSDDNVCPLLCYLYTLRQPARVVPHYSVVKHIDTDFSKLLGDIPRVCIGDVTEKQLRTDRYDFGVVGFHFYSPTGICSIPLKASSTRAWTSSADSTASTSFSFGLVRGWRGVKTVQQSSYGRIDVPKVPIFRARRTISSLSNPIRGWMIGIPVTALVTAMASIVCEATCRDSPP